MRHLDEDAYFAFDSSRIGRPTSAPSTRWRNASASDRSRVGACAWSDTPDPRGEPDYNLTLGQTRADSVEQYLDRHGVQQSKVGTTSRGAMDATGQDEAGWAHDRRVSDLMLGSEEKAAMGAIAGPPGIAAGAIVGGSIEAIAGVAEERDDPRRAAHDAVLDEQIGVAGGEIGAPNLKHRPAMVGALLGRLGRRRVVAAEAARRGPMSSLEDDD